MDPDGKCSMEDGKSWKAEKRSACEGCLVYLASVARHKSVSPKTAVASAISDRRVCNFETETFEFAWSSNIRTAHENT